MVFIQRKEQFSGCLVGQCLGDALGFPVEGFPVEMCAPYVERLRACGAKQAFAASVDSPFGQYTDDSQLARELMVSYAALARFDPADYAARIQSIFEWGPHRGSRHGDR
jgi:ADP-ribosylglycohydrolase